MSTRSIFENEASMKGSQSWFRHALTLIIKPSEETVDLSIRIARRLWLELTIRANQSSTRSRASGETRISVLAISNNSCWWVLKVNCNDSCEALTRAGSIVLGLEKYCIVTSACSGEIWKYGPRSVSSSSCAAGIVVSQNIDELVMAIAIGLYRIRLRRAEV